MLNRNDKKEIAGKLKALFPKASDSGREQLLNLLVNCCCIDLCSINSNADDIQFTGLTLLGNTLSLTLTINGVPTTQVVNLPTQISTTLVNNGDGTFTYTNESNVVTTIDVATLLVDAGISDGFVNNNDGTLTHAAIDGTVVTFDINDLLLTTTPLFTVNAGTTSVSTDASLGSQVITYGDILHFWSNGSLNFNVQAGSVVVGIDTEADIIPYVPTTLTSTNVGDALDELANESHAPTTLTNNAAAFSWNSGTQTGNIPLTPTLVDNGDGTITYNPNNGAAPITIDVTENASEVLTTTPITINGTTYPANTTVETILSAVSAYAGTTNLTYTPSATNGTIVSDTGTDATIPSATTSLAGLLTSTDKTKLDGIAIGANNYVHPNHSGDVTSVADGVTTIAPNAVTNAKLAQAPANTLKGNNTGAVANVTDLSVTDVKTLLTYTGADVANTPAGNIAATTVQAAINELDGEKQVNLQFQEEGVNLGTSGTVDTVNFTGAAVTSSRVGNTLTVDIPASAGVTNLSYTPSATNGIVVSDTGTDATITSVTGVNAGLATPAMLTNSHVPATFNDSGTIDFTVSGTDNQTVTATLLGVSGATIGQVPQSDGAGNITWVTPTSATNLTYTASPTQGTVLSDTGTDAIIPSVTVTDAGLATPSLLANSHVPVTTTAGTVTITQSGTDNQTLKADITGISGATAGQIPSTDGAGNVVWTTPTSSTADNGLTETLGNIQLGGTLIQDTVIDQAGFKLDVYNNTSGITTHITQTDTFLGLPVAGVGTAATDAGNMTAYQFSGDFGGVLRNQIGVQDFTGADTHNTSIQQNAVAGNTYTKIVSTDGASSTYSQLQVKENSTEIVANDGTNVNTLTVEADKLIVSQYPNTRDDSGVTPPINFLYTNGSGDFLSAPTSGIVANEWHTTGNAGTDGSTTNFVGTTDAQDLVLKTNNVEIARFGQQGNTTIGSDLTSIDALYISPLSSNPGDMAFQSGQATGIMSTAFGASSATAPGSMAWGVGYKNGISPIASGVSSTAWGDETSANGDRSTCFGFQNIANGDQSTCFGQENTNNANYATVFGFQNTAEGNLSTIFGSANISDINGVNSTIWGTGNQVSNAYGTAWGQDNVASGISSTVFGKSNRSEALYSLASGFNNVASGDNSVVFGAYNNSVSYAEMVLGHFSTFYIPISITTINTADRLLTVGNGANALTTNNALTMWKDGRSMWNGDVAKQNTWIGVNGTNPQNFINVTTPTGNLAAISTEHTTSGNYVVLGSNAGNSGLAINNTKQFAFTTTAGTTSTQLGATTTVGNYSSTGFLFGGGGVATSTVDVSGTLGLSNTRINTANPVLNLNSTVYHFTGGASGTVNMTVMTVDNRTFILTNYSGVSLTLSNSVRIGSAATTTSLPDNTSMTIAYDGAEFFRIA